MLNLLKSCSTAWNMDLTLVCMIYSKNAFEMQTYIKFEVIASKQWICVFVIKIMFRHVRMIFSKVSIYCVWAWIMSFICKNIVLIVWTCKLMLFAQTSSKLLQINQTYHLINKRNMFKSCSPSSTTLFASKSCQTSNFVQIAQKSSKQWMNLYLWIETSKFQWLEPFSVWKTLITWIHAKFCISCLANQLLPKCPNLS